MGLLFAWYFCVVGAAFAGRTVRDALFLTNVGADHLPLMYIATPMLAALAGALYTAIARRISRRALVLGSLLGSAAGLGGCYVLVGLGQAVEVGLYFAVSVMSGVMIGQVWMIASDRFTSQDAKRVFGLIGAGGTAADIVVGGVISLTATRLGAEFLLVLAGVLLVGGAVAGALLERSGGAGWEGHVRARPSPGAPEAKRPPGTAHLRLLGIATVVGIVVVTLVDFQFKAIAADTFGSDQGAMASWFGAMSVATGVVALGIQLLVTRHALHHAGVAGALMALPLGLALGETALIVVPGLVLATVLKVGDETLRFSVHDAASQLAFLPVPSSARTRLRAHLDNRWRPAAQLLSGAALFGYRSVLGTSIRPLAVVAIAGAVVWVAILARMRAAYRVSLAETLRQRLPSPEDVDPTQIPAEEWASLVAGLAAPSTPERLAALELARPVANALVEPIGAALAHPDPEVRRSAARALVGTPFRGWPATVADPDPEVRAIGRAALAAAGDPAARTALQQHLSDPDPAVCRQAVRACGPGTEALLTAAVSPAQPAVAAAILSRLGDLGTAPARAALLPLLDHPRLAAAAVRALSRATRLAPLTPAEADVVDRRIRAELEGAFRALSAAETMGKAESALAPDGTREANPFARGDAIGAAGLLSKALRERQEVHRERILGLLAARFPGAGLDRVRANLLEPAPSRRANAVELLDSTLPGDVRHLVVALVDDTPRYQKLAVGEKILDLPRSSREAWLTTFLTDPSPFLAACAAYYVGAFGLGALRGAVAAHATSPDPLLGPTAAHALTLLDAA